MESTPPGRWTRFRNWLHALPDWQFTGVLYLLRWVVIVPLSFVLMPFASSEAYFQAKGDPWGYLISVLVLAPFLETLIECTLPHWILYGLLMLKTESPWPFVIASAMVMVILHPLVIPTIVFAFVTGAFLAYVYRRFSPESHWKAILHTTVYHAGINLVGWSMLMWAYYV